jgi:hypothetical protein
MAAAAKSPLSGRRLALFGIWLAFASYCMFNVSVLRSFDSLDHPMTETIDANRSADPFGSDLWTYRNSQRRELATVARDVARRHF